MKFSTILRLAAIALGIVSATIMAQRGFEIRFNEDFLTFFNSVGEIVGVIVTPIEIVLRHVLAWFSSLGVEIELQDHWRYAFILMWLFLGAWARAQTVFAAFTFIWGGFCSLLAGVLAGSVPLSNPGVFWWPFACYLLFLSGGSVWIATAYRNQNTNYNWLEVFWGVFGRRFFFSVVLAVIANVAIFLLFPLLRETSAPYLATLAVFVGLAGLINLVEGAFRRAREGNTWWQQWLGSPNARMGLDMLSVLGGAAVITYLAHVLA